MLIISLIIKLSILLLLLIRLQPPKLLERLASMPSNLMACQHGLGVQFLGSWPWLVFGAMLLDIVVNEVICIHRALACELCHRPLPRLQARRPRVDRRNELLERITMENGLRFICKKILIGLSPLALPIQLPLHPVLPRPVLSDRRELFLYF